MPRSATRARKRRRFIDEYRRQFVVLRRDPESLVAFLRYCAAADIPLWAVCCPYEGDRPLDDSEQAMIAQLIAPHLAGMTPGSIRKRNSEGVASPASKRK